MKNLEYFQKKQAEATLEIENQAKSLESLQQKHAELEEQINAAIDAERLEEVERLTAKETEIDNRIKAAEKILERKKARNTMPPEEMAAASNAEMEIYQKRCDSIMEEAQKIRRQYLSKLLEAAKIVNEARSIRLGYLQLADIDTRNRWKGANVRGFDNVSVRFPEQLTGIDGEILRSIQPDAVQIIQTAR